MRLIERPDFYIYITFMTNNARLPGGGGEGEGEEVKWQLKLLLIGAYCRY
jgi:hypothetical protein